MEVLLPQIKLSGSGLTTPVNIQGIGFSVPDKVVTNAEIIKGLNSTEQWIQNKTGIKERRFLEDDLITSDLCLNACKEALLDANISALDIDVIILSTITPDQLLPSTALVLKEKLGAFNAIPIDLNQVACAGGIYSIYLGAHLLQSNNIQNVLVIGGEVLSRITDTNDRTTRVFFGDAAGAVVLQKTKEGYGLLSYDIDSKLNYAVQRPGGGSEPLPYDEDIESSLYLKMDGREVWNIATEVVPASIIKTVDKAGLSIPEIDYFFIHQANVNIINSVLNNLNIPKEKTNYTIQDYGNTGSATIFSCLYHAIKNNSIKNNDNIVFSAIGAGFVWGSLCFKYNKN